MPTRLMPKITIENTFVTKLKSDNAGGLCNPNSKEISD